MLIDTYRRLRGPLLGAVAGIVFTSLFGRMGDAMQTARLSAAAAPTGETWPAQFPRPGATKVFENDRVIVWDQIYQDQPFMHRHVRDQLNILMEDGPIKVTDATGTERLLTSPNKGKTGVIGYFKAGLGPHSEIAADPTRRPRIIYIEFKGTEPSTLVDGRWPK
jgi:hypothetical protein